MRTFIQFIESNSIIPVQSSSLSEFLKTFIGSNIQDILDKSSYTNLYLGNKYGFGNPNKSDKLVKDFANTLVSFVNRDVLKHRPTDRLYDTQEFKDANNYAEYEQLDKQRRDIFRQMIGKSGEEREALMKKKSEIENKISDTEFSKARQEVNRGYDRAVENYHRRPLTAEDLQDDGSEIYRKLEAIFNELVADRSNKEDDTPALDMDYIDV